MYNSKNDITYGIDSNVRRALFKSIENNSKESFHVLEGFVRNVLQLSVRNRSIKHFQQYIFFPAYYYSISFEKAKSNISLDELHKICSSQAAIHLKEILWIDLSIFGKKRNELEQRNEINPYYYWAFNSFGRLLYYIVKNSDISAFKNALNELDQVTDGNCTTNYDLKFRIKDLKRDNQKGVNNEIIEKLKSEYYTFEQFNTYDRHVRSAIKYWVILLYSENIVSKETASVFLDSLRISYTDADDMLNDIFFFRGNNAFSYMDWQSWDFIERPTGKVYSPPSPHNWMTLGFMADQIRGNRLYVNLDELDNEGISQAQFLYEDLKKYYTYFQNNFTAWSDILNVKSEDELKTKCDNILSLFAQVKRKSLSENERAIAKEPLSEKNINNFKDSIGKAWNSQARIHRLFMTLGNTEHISDDEIKLKVIGRRTFFEKAKMMFIESEHYQMIYGIDTMGGEIGRWGDNVFFSQLLKEEYNSENGLNALDVLDKMSKALRKKEVVPNLILLSPEFSYKDEALLKSSRFISKINEPPTEEGLAFFYLGSFDDIPIYSSFSDLLKNKIIACNFNDSFKMRYKTNPNWFHEELKVDVIAVNDEEAIRKLKENPEKWKNTEDGIELSDEDALILIKTSVIIDIGTNVDFQILNKDSYIIGNIKSESKDFS